MENPRYSPRIPRCGSVLLLAMAAWITPTVSAADNQRPSVQYTIAPAPLSAVHYAQQFAWSGLDPDGIVVSYRYAIDPLPVDTFWIDTPDTTRYFVFVAQTPETPYAGPGLPQFCSDPHVVVVESVDDLGLESPPEARMFTARNQAPATLLTSPPPIPSSPPYLSMTSSPVFDWTGNDPDGVFTARPVRYKHALASRPMIQSALGFSGFPTEAQLQQYFSLEAPGFASWNSSSSDTTRARFHFLQLGQYYYFAVVGFDEAGGWDPRFTRSTNVLAFRVTSTVDVSGAEAPELSLAPPSPNPAHHEVVFDFALPRGGDVRIDIFDTAGRRVRAQAIGRREGGRHALVWDLTDDSGSAVRPGAYLARVAVDGAARVRRFVVMP